MSILPIVLTNDTESFAGKQRIGPALIYESGPLAAQDRFQHWYQWAVLGIGSFSLLVPLTYYLFVLVRYKWRLYKARPEKIVVEPSDRLLHALQAVTNTPYIDKEPVLPKIMRYALWDTARLTESDEIDAIDLVAVPLNAALGQATGDSSVILAYCDPASMVENTDAAASTSKDISIVQVMEQLHHTMSRATIFSGIVLPLSGMYSPVAWMTLAQHLCSLNLIVFFELHPDYKALEGINLSLVHGLIVRNATILPNGMRREFFRGFELRDVLARCNRQKTTRETFTTILHDPCQLPSTPTLRRAYKFARFHEVVLSVCQQDLTQLPACLPLEEPQSAFDWLKRLDVLDLHKAWNDAIVLESVSSGTLDFSSLEKVLPGIEATFFRTPTGLDTSENLQATVHAPKWADNVPTRTSFFLNGENGQLLSNLACFDLREQITDTHVRSILETQRHMRRLALSEQISIYELQEVIEQLESFMANSNVQETLSIHEYDLVKDCTASLKQSGIRVVRGLDSGFTLPENRFHMWSVAEEDDGIQYIYISLMAKELVATILHTVLLLNGVQRRRCFEIELILAAAQGRAQGLPPRVVSELRNSTYAELLNHLAQIRISRDADCVILQNVVRFVHHLLIEESTRAAWKKVHGEEFLAERISVRDLFQHRLNWLAQRGIKHLPHINALVRAYRIAEHNIISVLRRNDLEAIDILAKVLNDAYKSSQTEASIEQDLIGLIIFCVFRKYAVEETYIESSDRCPVYHFQTDQPGVFSELWVIGSQCEVYFDVTPGILGALHYERYRKYLLDNPPPDDCWNGIDVFTAYHKVESPTAEGTVPGDEEIVNPFEEKNAVFFPRLQKFAFLSVFCAPAVCDVMLLVFLGRGVFQSAFMRGDEVAYSTLGLLTALLICSGTIAWTGSSGGYYLYNAAFDSLNHLLVQKLSGAFCLTLAVGVLGGLGIGGQRGWYCGFIFFIYLMGLSTYLNILGILATMHRDGSPLPSGRSVLWKSLPVLLISPIVTTFVHGYDIVIYVIVIYTFLTVLYFNYRALCAEWSQFYTKVKCIDDKQVLAWYKKMHPDTKEEVDYEDARAMLETAVMANREPRLTLRKQKKIDTDQLEVELAPGLEYARWLLKKDAGPGASAPSPFSSAWNNQLKVSLNTYQNFVRGLKEHSAFLQYRYAKNDIGYNVVMFIAVLLDRWVAITMSAAGDGPLNLYENPRNRFSISFALSFFLTSAVALDYQLQFCWIAVVATSTRMVSSAEKLDNEEKRERGRRKQLYWKSLIDLVTIMFMLFGFWTLMLVFWVDDPVQLETYFAYSAAYSCVLWFQFNRVFIKDATKAFLLVAGSICIGYTVGVVLHVLPATYNFHFIDIIAMGTCNVCAAILSFCAADFGSSRDDVEDDFYSPQDLMHKTGWKLHSQKFIGLDWNASNKLHSTLEHLSILPDAKKLLRVTANHTPDLMLSVEAIFANLNPPRKVQKAFPEWQELCATALNRVLDGQTRVYLMSAQDFVDLGLSQVSAVGRLTDEDILEICLPVIVVSEAWTLIHHEHLAQLVCEALIHETCELVLKMSHSDAACAELIVAQQSVPLRMVNQIKAQSASREVEEMIQAITPEILKHCCLGIKVNVAWTTLPEDVRRMITARVMGLAYNPKISSTDFLEMTLQPGVAWQQTLTRSNTKIALALAIDQLCKTTLQSGNLAHERHVLPPSTFAHSSQDIFVKSNNLRLRMFYALYVLIQYIAVVSNGEPDVPRELVYLTRGNTFRSLLRPTILFFWKLCAKFRRFSIELTLLHSRPELKSILQFCRRGIERRLYKDRITVEDAFTPVTGFLDTEENKVKVSIYPGVLATRPEDVAKLTSSAAYDEDQRLIELEIYSKGQVSDTARYNYEGKSRRPLSRTNNLGTSFYDAHGRISHGNKKIGEDEWTFSYEFTPDVESSDVLKSTFASLDTTIHVYWCVPKSTAHKDSDMKFMLPAQKVSRAIYLKNEEQWEIQYEYHHKRDPTTVCVHTNSNNDIKYLDTVPEWISKDPNKFLIKPKLLHFDTEDLLYRHPPIRTLSWWRRLGHLLPRRSPRTAWSPMGSSALRTMLWERWHKSKSLDGVTACYVDTQIVRQETYLRRYWTLRESGHLYEAARYLDEHVESINARIEIEDSVSQNTFLPYKMSDLYTMGAGGSANVKTRKFEENYADTEDRLSVMFLDTGCFPDQPGGVSNCRRDLVNGHTTIRNHVFTESANDFGVPRFQVDKNVQSVKVLPMWGLDYLSPYHGLFENLLDSQVTYREHHTSDKDIETLFLPILRRIIKGARSLVYSQQDLVELTQAFVDINIYFEEKDYLKTWNSDLVKRAWREGWLEDTDNAVSTSTYFPLELPSMAQLDEALELWRRYCFVFSVRIPEVVPTVFQCTHHGVGSIFGMLLKLRRGTTYMIWDHAIYWRESCLNVSSSQCILALSVQNMLLGLIKMASHLCYTHADVILPCTNLFNPGWEADIGSDQGRRAHKIGFARKIDPVVNGISEMERFEPVEKIGSEFPTVMMLSNVQFIKDVKNAVFSADIIVNRFKFTKYRLVIYGAMDRTPQYTAETEAIIKTRGLSDNVKLAGFGNPKEILKNAWAFMNSSLSEGLPLAIGEAALSGCPIIATDVGATALVISDPKNPKIRYGEIVPPNDAVALARAQIQILAMLGPWASYCGDTPPPMPEHFTTADVDRITQRMYDQTEARRALGRKGRETVLHSFNGNRYLREHEQMYWLGSYRSKQRRNPLLQKLSREYIRFDELLPIQPTIPVRRSKLWDEDPWRYFEDKDDLIDKLWARFKTFVSTAVDSTKPNRRASSVVTELRYLSQPSEHEASTMSSRNASFAGAGSEYGSVISLARMQSKRKEMVRQNTDGSFIFAL